MGACGDAGHPQGLPKRVQGPRQLTQKRGPPRFYTGKQFDSDYHLIVCILLFFCQRREESDGGFSYISDWRQLY